ncbi:hypothetical protein L1987_73743 [Smallanthus sonchifolius]|uniref:Uncharacterized protein n=1 Tax=Smallanthus sonchifolius TaxID=185202 RepID=A0ACB9A598_9ASTR|nr:hypothetical protein L1987_73743 [Smallanthus sonchifolius]
MLLSQSLSSSHILSIAQIWILHPYFTPQTSNSYLLNRRSKQRCLVPLAPALSYLHLQSLSSILISSFSTFRKAVVFSSVILQQSCFCKHAHN